MDTVPPPPPSFFFTTTPTTTNTAIPQPYDDDGTSTNDVVSNHHHSSSSSSSSSPATSVIIVMIIISSAVIISAGIYLLIRFFTRHHNPRVSSSNDVVSRNSNENEHVHHHVISITNNDVSSLPLFTFSSLNGKINGGDCSVCLSKFDGDDQLRLLPLCFHAFHVECIDSWLKTNLTCPLCRSTVNPTESDILSKIASNNGDTVSENRSNSFRIEIGNISRRRDPVESDRRTYSVGSFDYVINDGYELPVESTDRNAVDKDLTAPQPPEHNLTAEIGGSERRNWLRDYVDRVSVSLSSRSISFRGSGRFFTGSSRRSEVVVDDYEATHGRIGEEISELFRWLSGV